MRPLDPSLLAALRALVRGLEAADVKFCVIGALVPEFLLDEKPMQLTRDADAVVVLQSLNDFDLLKGTLATSGFRPTPLVIRMRHEEGGVVDILPYSHALAPEGTLELPGDPSFNVAGFDQLFASAVHFEIETGLRIPLAPLSLYVLLKLVAFSDRHQPKDLGSVLHCLRQYEEASDRRYGLEHDRTLVPFEMTTAYLLGLDGRPVQDASLRNVVPSVLDQLVDPGSSAVEIAGRTEGRLLLERDHRQEIVDLFRWFRLGAGL